MRDSRANDFAGGEGDDERHYARDAQITILQTTDLHDHANGAGHVGLDVDRLPGRSTMGAYVAARTRPKPGN